MKEDYQFKAVQTNDEIAGLKQEWIESLTSPQDGMWESFRDNAQNWAILMDEKLVGYASVNDDNQLIQFYISSRFIATRNNVFKNLIQQKEINAGIVGTNNPIYLSVALNFVKSLSVHTYLFRDHESVIIPDKEGILNKCKSADTERIVNFCHYSMGAPKEWLIGYISGLIERGEIFSFENDDNIIGTCEIRRSTTSPDYADIGMVVSPDHRRNGYGTYLLHRAKRIAMGLGLTPICSCENENIGSIRSIQNCGFTSMHQLLSIKFK